MFNAKVKPAARRIAVVPLLIALLAPGCLWAADAQSLESRLQAVEDYMLIEKLLMRYAAAYNTGDAATVRAFFMEVVSNGENIPPGSKPPTIHAMGRYEDELEKVNGEWLFSKRTVITDLNTKWQP